MHDRPSRLPRPGSDPLQTVVVYESAPFRTPELQREFLHTDVGVRGSTRLDDVPAWQGADVAVLDLAGGPRGVPGAVVRLRKSSPHTMIVVMLPAALAEYEWLLRDVGVDVVLPEPVHNVDLISTCRKLLRAGGCDPR